MVLKGFSISETGAAETRSIPAWSTKHFEATGRPLRIAIDQSNWWYRNITADKDAEIRTRSPGSHPREKRIMERIFYLLRVNIQLLFVFDGPDKPPKKCPDRHSYSESNVRLLKELLDQLGVPRHDAPGEAVAECAQLQDLGVVDAVWTDNTDALLFGGSPTLVQFPARRPEGDQFRRAPHAVTVAPAARIRERANLTREWFLMYATLVGSGYADGLAGLDAPRFLRFARHGCFQAAANLLAAAVETPLVLSKWRIVVAGIISATFPAGEGEGQDGVAIAAPPRTFPDLAVLKACAHPVVSPDDVLRDLPCLRGGDGGGGWFRPYGPDMLSRYRFLLSNFNTQIHESWVARDLVPIELNHRLRAAAASSSSPSSADEREANGRLGVESRPKRKDGAPESVVTVDPLKVLPELLSAFPSEMYRVVNGARVRVEAPVFRPEKMELLDCVLRRGLPESDSAPKEAAQPPTPAKGSPKRRPPVPPPKNESSRNFQPAGGRLLAKRRPNPEQRPHRACPALPRINTHLDLPLALHGLDTSSSPTCIHFHDGLTLPGELDWYLSPSPLPPPSPLLPVSRRASALAPKLSGAGPRRPSIAPPTSPVPMLKQPAWDHSVVAVDLANLNLE
ncbi:PIN domain-like protein [Xylaria palmicola]|nr:PIN domain-like protein [Xylaria palmicola]